MNYIDLKGKWKNQFGSVMDIIDADAESGIFCGRYSSTTGATGTYRLTGITDTRPDHKKDNNNSQTVAFAVSWRDLGGDPSGQHWVSAFSGQVQLIDGKQVLQTTYLLQANTLPQDDWGATKIAFATFERMADMPMEREAPRVVFALARGTLSNNGGTPWIAAAGIGTPAQTLRFMLDTGTDNTWVTSTQCTSNACLAHQRFDPTLSDTYRSTDRTPIQKDFGPWGSMTVLMGEDIFTLKQVRAEQALTISTRERMRFEAAINYTGAQFQELACDGGIAIPSPFGCGPDQSQALMLQLLKDEKISYPVAAFWCDVERGVGECTFGAIDPGKYQPDTLQWMALQDPGNPGLDYLWSVKLQEFKVGGKAVHAGITQFVLDTGSSYFKGPADLIGALVAAVTDHGRLPTYVSSPEALAQYPVIALTLGREIYELHPKQYFLQLNDQYWELGIEVLQGMPEGMLLVGSMFLDPLYCIFDYGGMRVGLARR